MSTAKNKPRLVIVGGGYLGSNLAKSLDGEMDVTLIERATHFTHAPAMIRAMVDPPLLDQALIPYSGLLERGKVVQGEADLIVPAVGSRAHTPMADTLPNVDRAADGRIKVDGYLRPSSLPNVFAAGDIAAAGDAMTIVGISRQKPWLEKSLNSLASGKRIEDLKPYAPWGDKAPILVPLGPQRGSAFLMAFTGGDWITRMMKGKGLFLSKYRKLLNQS